MVFIANQIRVITRHMISTTSQIGQHDIDGADTDIFSLAPVLSHTATALGASFLMVCLAFVFPWDGGRSTSMLTFFFGLAVAGSAYALWHGYSQIFKHGLKAIGIFAWGVAVLVSIALSVSIIIFGADIAGTQVIFPGSNIFTSPVVFASLVIFQTLYFLIEAVLISAGSHESDNHHMQSWFLSGYLWILSVNSAAVIVGLLILGYFSPLW